MTENFLAISAQFSWALFPFIVAAAALATGLIVVAFLESLQKQREVQRMSIRLQESVLATDDGTGNSDKEKRAGLKVLVAGEPITKFCLRYGLGRQLLQLMDKAGLSDRREAYFQWLFMLAGLVALCTFALSSVLMMFVLVILLIAASFAALQTRADKRTQELRAALPDLLDELAQSLRAGRSFPQSLNFVLHAQAAGSPLVSILTRLDADARLGRNCSQSLQDLAVATGLRELKSIASVLDITTRVGGNTPSLFEQAATSIRQDLMLNKKLKVQTAQGRSSVRLVGSVPFALIGLMSIIMPGYLGLWLSSSGGQLLFAVAMILVAVGFFWVRSVVDIRV